MANYLEQVKAALAVDQQRKAAARSEEVKQWEQRLTPLVERLSRLLAQIPAELRAQGLSLPELRKMLHGRRRGNVHPGELGAAPARLGVIGQAAGAHLAMMIALDRRYMAAVGAPRLIRAAVGLAGPYDFLPFDVPASINAFGRVDDPTLTQPVTFARADAPPLWLGHGTEDVIVHAEDTTILCERMRAVGGRCEEKPVPAVGEANRMQPRWASG